MDRLSKLAQLPDKTEAVMRTGAGASNVATLENRVGILAKLCKPDRLGTLYYRVKKKGGDCMFLIATCAGLGAMLGNAIATVLIGTEANAPRFALISPSQPRAIERTGLREYNFNEMGTRYLFLAKTL